MQSGLLFGVATVLFVASAFFGINVPTGLRNSFNTLLALTPALLWGFFSLLPEIRAPEPRSRLLIVFIITALGANAVGIPLLRDSLQPERWLSLSDFFGRIIGYAVTIGIIREAIKYMVLRFTVWPGYYRVREDAIAYGVAAAIAYATVESLHFSLNSSAAPDIVAARVFFTVAVHMLATLTISYGLSELHFDPKSLLLLPASLLLAVLITGIGITARTGLVNAGFVLGLALPRSLFGLAFSFAFFAGLLAAIAFFFHAAERRQREAYQGPGA